MHIRRKHGVSVIDNPRLMGRLQASCERAKVLLSSSLKASVELDISGDVHYIFPISRDELNVRCESKFEAILDQAAQVVSQSSTSKSPVTKSSIQEILLVGGATRMTGIVDELKAYFSETNPSITSVRDLDEAVVFGCAIQAAVLGEGKIHGPRDWLDTILLLDVVPQSLGVAVTRGNDAGEFKTLPSDGGSPHERAFSRTLPRNSTIPTKKTETFSCSSIDGISESTVSIQVYEGESDIPTANTFLGCFELHGIRSLPNSEVRRIQVSFDIDARGRIVVTAEVVGGERGQTRSMEVRVGRMPQYEKDRLKNRAREWDALDRQYEALTQRRNNLEEYCYSFRDGVEGVHEGIAQCLQWLDDTASRSVTNGEYTVQEDSLAAALQRILPPGYIIMRTGADQAQES